MKVLMIRSSYKNSNSKKTKSIFHHFYPSLEYKVDPPPSGATWATFYTAK